MQVRDVLLRGCGRCGGLWLDNDASMKVIQSPRPDVLAAAPGGPAPVDTEASIRCPLCQRSLARYPALDPSVQVDVCEDHGTWFDRDELRRVSTLAAQKRGEGGPAAPAAPSATGGGISDGGLFSYDPGVVMAAHETWQKFLETLDELVSIDATMRRWWGP